MFMAQLGIHIVYLCESLRVFASLGESWRILASLGEGLRFEFSVMGYKVLCAWRLASDQSALRLAREGGVGI